MIPRMATTLWEPGLPAKNDNAVYLPTCRAYREQARLLQDRDPLEMFLHLQFYDLNRNIRVPSYGSVR